MKRSVSKVAKEIGVFLDEAKPIDAHHIAVPRSRLTEWLLLLCPPRAGFRKVRNERVAARRATKKDLDSLCRRIVFSRDGNKCRRCGRTSGKMDWSHVYAKGAHPWLRWDLDNSKVLCVNCHMGWWHAQPKAAGEWWEKELGPEKWRALVLRAARPRKVTPTMVQLYLKVEAEKIGCPTSSV